MAPRKITVWALSAAVATLGACSAGGPVRTAAVSAGRPTLSPSSLDSASRFTGSGKGHLAAGSDPSVLPRPVLIADEGNNRLVIVDPRGRVAWTFPRPGDLPPGVEFKAPDDAFFTPDGRQIIVTEEEYSVVSLVDITTHKLVWRYGTPGRPGAGPGRLSNPDDALMLPHGAVLTADIKNCRLLLIDRGARAPRRTYGTPGVCRHDPPTSYGLPNGAFPMRNGHYLVTEITGDWVDEVDLSGRLYAALHPPGVRYPSDSNEVSPGTYLTVDYSSPGQVETFDRAGSLRWRYRPTGAQALDHPSLAFPLPNGMVLATDDHNDRIIVIDPRTNRIVWQYGLRAHPGAAPGLLNGPDGLDLAPPNSDLVVHARTMSQAH
jgi:outer membrane protein assembly factor BamB